MLSDVLEKGIDVLKKNKVIFLPFIIFGIISILITLLTLKPMFEFSTYQSLYSSSPSYFFKKFIDITNLIIASKIILFILEILANVAGLRAVKDYLNNKKTKISDMGKTTIIKGPAAIFSVLAASILFFLPGIIGFILILLSLSSLPSSFSYPHYSEIEKFGGIMALAFVLFFIQMIILLAFGYYILSKKFRKIYLWTMIITSILLILSIIGLTNPSLAIIFLIPFFVLFIFLLLVLMFIAYIVIFSIIYILPSAIVLDDMDMTNAIKNTLNFVKNNTKNFTFVVIIIVIIQMVISFPIFIISLVNSFNPSFSLYAFEEIFPILLDIIVAPYFLSVFALTYAYSLMKASMKEKESTHSEEIKGAQNLESGGLGKI